jgi:hypothetical protein
VGFDAARLRNKLANKLSRATSYQQPAEVFGGLTRSGVGPWGRQYSKRTVGGQEGDGRAKAQGMSCEAPLVIFLQGDDANAAPSRWMTGQGSVRVVGAY